MAMAEVARQPSPRTMRRLIHHPGGQPCSRRDLRRKPTQSPRRKRYYPRQGHGACGSFRSHQARAGCIAGTVSAIVNRLIKSGLVYEGTEGPSSGGRPPKNLYINAESFYVLAVDIGVSDTVFAVSDFNGRILHQNSILTEKSRVSQYSK